MDNIRFIKPTDLHAEMLRLHQEQQMDFLECLTGMDWGETTDKDTPDTPRGLGVVYHLESTTTGERLVVRTATLDRKNAELPSVSDIWKAADFLEREVYDFYGIVFIGHPDMRRLYLRNDWVGYPMRKDNDPEKDNPLRMDNEETIDTTTELALNPDGTIKNKELILFGDEEYVVNIGPQHPATHGVMRFRVSLEGETIEKIDANCGYIHRGIEKMCESLTYPQTLALTDRLDYLGAHQTRHGPWCFDRVLLWFPRPREDTRHLRGNLRRTPYYELQHYRWCAGRSASQLPETSERVYPLPAWHHPRIS